MSCRSQGPLFSLLSRSVNLFVTESQSATAFVLVTDIIRCASPRRCCACACITRWRVLRSAACGTILVPLYWLVVRPVVSQLINYARRSEQLLLLLPEKECAHNARLLPFFVRV